MKLPGAAIVVSALCLLISCGGDGNGGGKGGSGGSGGAAGASAGGAGGGSAGNTGSTGSAGATGSAGSGGGSCQACNTCVTASCASQVAACMGNSDCNKIYQCAKACTTSIQTCLLNNAAAAQMFASSVYPCISSNCGTECNY